MCSHILRSLSRLAAANPSPGKRAGSLFVMLALGCIGSTTLTAVPAAPTNLTAAVAGGTVTLSWTAPPTEPLGYRLEAGTALGLSNVASTLLAPGTSFVASGVPAGTYYVRVRAVDNTGESAASNEVEVVVGGLPCAAAPDPPFLTVAVSAATVTLAWTASTGCPATSYGVVAGSQSGAADIVVVNVGNVLGFSADAPPGTYYVRAIAHNAFGASTPSNEVVAVVSGATSTPLPTFAVTMPPLTADRATLVMPASGLYRATLTWSDPAVDVDLYLAVPGCNFYPPLPCLLTVSDASTGTMEQISWLVNAGEVYEIWGDNWSNVAAPVTLEHAIIHAPGDAAHDRLTVRPVLPKIRPQ
jgi:hypothetical protein